MPIFDPNIFDAGIFDAGDADVEVDAGLASGSGAANNASVRVSPNAGLAAGTGAALDATAAQAAFAVAGAATGTGSSLDVSAHVQPSAELASGTGAGLDATASTSSNVSANAELASGTGAASGPAPAIAPNAGLATGTGAANGATVASAVSASAGLASGSGAAADATVDTGAVAAQPAFQGDAFQNDAFQTAAVGTVYAGVATGTGQAYDAVGFEGVAFYAETATGTGSALGPTPSVAPHPGVGTGTGTAHQIMVVGVATGTGAAYDAAIFAEDNYGATPEGDIATGYMPPLAAPIDDNDTTIIVEYPSTTDPDEPFVVLIDGEQVLVTNVSGTTWTVERGYNGSTATAHGAGAVARPALVRIRVDGVDIAPDVDYRRSRFTTGANGQAGIAEIWVRDLDRTRSFVTGVEVIVSFRGVRQWGGYLASIRRQYVFPYGTGQIGDEPRWLLLDCVDYNVLFNKRVFFKPGDADHMAVKHWPNGTWDSVVISEVVRNYLTLEDDNLRFDITHVGTPALPQISCDPNAPDHFGVGSAGWTWGQVMTAIASQTGAVYYIDPERTFRYVDDSIKQSRFGWSGLSDDPDNVTTIGYRDVEFTLDASKMTNDHLQWGAGQGRDEMVFARTRSISSIEEHGLWQTAEVRFDMYCQDSVDQRGETWVYGSPQNRRGGKDDRFYSRVTVREPYFRVADVVELRSTEFNFVEIAPVRNAEITFPTPWDIRAILTIAHEIDAPWATLEFWMPQFDFDFDIHGLEGPHIDWPPPWGPDDPCEDADIVCVVEDTFTRTGASLGTSDSGHTWGVPAGVTNTYTPTTDGSEALLQVESGFSAGGTATTHLGSGRLNLASEGDLFLPLTASFRFQYSGIWDSNFVENPHDTASPPISWAPGYSTPDNPTSPTGPDGGDNYRRNYLAVAVSASIPIYRFNIYNAGGALYGSAVSPGRVDGATTGATLIGAQLEPDTWCNVKVHLDSDRVYLRIWPDGTDEPMFYQVQSNANGDTWADQEFQLFSVANLKNATTPAFTIVVDDLCIGRASYSGDALNRQTPGAVDTFTRSSAGGLGTGEIGAWSANASFEVSSNRGVALRAATPSETTILDKVVTTPGCISWDTKPIGQSSGSAQGGIVLAARQGNRVPLSILDMSYAIRLNYLGGGEMVVAYSAFGDDTGAITDRGVMGTTIIADYPIDEFVTWALHFSDDEIRIVGTSSSGSVILDTTVANDPTIPSTSHYHLSFVDQIVVYDALSTDVGDAGEPAFEFDNVNVCCDGCWDSVCGDAEPGEFADPVGDGPEIGEGANSDFEVGENGGIIFYTNEQFQVGSTEVWVNGLHIRINADYIEYPRNAKIEILDHIDVGTVGDPATVVVNYVVWTIDDPVLE